MNDLLTPPVQPISTQPFTGVLAGRLTWECPLGLARLVLDSTAFDFHLDVSPDHLPGMLKVVLTHLHDVGFEPMPENECPSELLADDWIRIYFTPVIPLDDSPLIVHAVAGA